MARRRDSDLCESMGRVLQMGGGGQYHDDQLRDDLALGLGPTELRGGVLRRGSLLLLMAGWQRSRLKGMEWQYVEMRYGAPLLTLFFGSQLTDILIPPVCPATPRSDGRQLQLCAGWWPTGRAGGTQQHGIFRTKQQRFHT